MLWCDHSGHAFEIPERHHRREMPELRKDPEDDGPGSGCCNRVQRIVYTSWSGSPRPGRPEAPPNRSAARSDARSRRGLWGGMRPLPRGADSVVLRQGPIL